jgi:Zn-dependent metalloprotease
MNSNTNLNGVKAKVEYDSNKNPKRIYEIKAKSSSEDPKSIADQFLTKISNKLRIDKSEMKFDKVKESVLGKHVLYQQHINDEPISGAWLRIDIDKDGKVYNVDNSCVGNLASKKGANKTEKKAISEEEAKKIVVEDLKKTKVEIVGSELQYVKVNNVPVRAWKILAKVKEPKREDWKIYVKADDGTIVKKLNIIKDLDGRGRVFDPNPVVKLNDLNLRDNSAIQEQAYEEVVLRDLDGSGNLDGPFVSTRTTNNRIRSPNNKFLFRREDRPFKEVMVYYHIDRFQRYIQELGLDNVLNHSINVSIDGQTDDNSHYSPFGKDLTFGTGGVDDAEDADIILHEYGHAIQDDIIPGWGEHKEGKAMGEAFGDYCAASFFADKKSDILKPTIGNWDATFYDVRNPRCLRRLDSNKLYPKDMTGEEHDDGEIWSACLWQIHALLGSGIADKLIISHHFLLNREAKFEDAANAILVANEQVNEGRNKEAIRSIFERRGILSINKRRTGEKLEDKLIVKKNKGKTRR